MKIITRFLFLILAVVALQGCTNEDGFVPLFNGRDFSGWVNVNGARSTWSVRDNMIVCSGIPTGVLLTTEQYENFILELEWKHLHAKGNAGLFVYSGALPVRGKPFTRAVECQIYDTNHGDVFPIQGATMVPDRPHPSGSGSMRCLPSEERAHPAGQWNHYRVESRDGRITLAVNGKVVSGGSQSVPRKGYIALESEGSEVHFRNIRIQTLPSSNPPPDQTASVHDGFVSLYSGVDFSGWKSESGGLEHWTTNDWRFDYDGKAKNKNVRLWSEKSYGDFELIADWRFTNEGETPEAGESGIILRGSEDHRIFIGNGIGNGTGGSGGLTSNVNPKVSADSELGRWNRFLITLKGNRLNVVLNEQTVMDQVEVPELPEQGPLALVGQGAPLQFANIYVKELP